jgi:GAF domain-containing protein
MEGFMILIHLTRQKSSFESKIIGKRLTPFIPMWQEIPGVRSGRVCIPVLPFSLRLVKIRHLQVPGNNASRSSNIVNGEYICNQLADFAAAGNSFDRLTEEAVRLVHNSNPRFHWTGIYELCADSVLRLRRFIGAPTDHTSIPVGEGVCGSAVAERRNKNIPDVTKEANYLACSISTKSELVVLIRQGEKIFAQIDIDSHDYDAFDISTAEEVQKVADWLAKAYAACPSQLDVNP